MTLLDLDTLTSLPRAQRPAYDVRSVRVGVVHLGFGAFHRAHQAVAFDRMLSHAPHEAWGICAVANSNTSLVRAARAQDHLFTVVTRSPEPDAAPTARVIGSVRETLVASHQADAVVERIASPGIHTVTLTITEAGYRVGGDDAWASPIGLLARGLDGRRQADAGLTVISCDNLVGNGAATRAAVLEVIARHPDRFSAALADWILASVDFPDTVVDRIVPRQTAADRGLIASIVGVDDRVGVVAEEAFTWAIQASAGQPAEAWGRAGIDVRSDLDRLQGMKLKILNATHSLLAYVGLARGEERIDQALADPGTLELARVFLRDEVLPTLAAPVGVDPARYADSVLARFGSPVLRDTTRRVAADGSHKLPQRLHETIQQTRRAGRTPRVSLTVIGLWMFLRLQDPSAFEDPVEPVRPSSTHDLRALREAVVATLDTALRTSPETHGDACVVTTVTGVVADLFAGRPVDEVVHAAVRSSGSPTDPRP